MSAWSEWPDAYAAWVGAQRGWRRHAVAFAAGAVSLLAMAPLFWFPVLWITLPTLVWLLEPDRAAGVQRHASTRAKWPWVPAALAGWWFGFGYLFFGLLWVGEAFLVEAEKFAWLLPFAVCLLPAGLALFYAFAGALAWCVSRPGLARVVALAVALGLSEWLRGHLLTGFPWNILGYALTAPPLFLQSAALAGVYGLTPCVVLIFAMPLVAWACAPPGPSGRSLRLVGLLIPCALLMLFSIYGLLRLGAEIPAPVANVRLRLVQPSIPQREKWQAEYQRRNFLAHLELSTRNAAGQRDDLAGITHVVWPEAAMPFQPLRSREALTAIGDLLGNGPILLAGGLRFENPNPGDSRGRAFNSLMVFGAGGELLSLYDKIHLVPFGEYLPFQNMLESVGLEQLTRLRGGFTSGPSPRPLLSVPGLPAIGVLICYEAIFPTEVVQGGERPSVLLNVTNDGWFGETWGPYQHFHQARVRAVEQGLPLIRSANNGISAVIDPYGRVAGELGLNVTGVADLALPSALTESPAYARYGNLTLLYEIALLCVILLWIAFGGSLRNKRPVR